MILVTKNNSAPTPHNHGVSSLTAGNPLFIIALFALTACSTLPNFQAFEIPSIIRPELEIEDENGTPDGSGPINSDFLITSQGLNSNHQTHQAFRLFEPEGFGFHYAYGSAILRLNDTKYHYFCSNPPDDGFDSIRVTSKQGYGEWSDPKIVVYPTNTDASSSQPQLSACDPSVLQSADGWIYLYFGNWELGKNTVIQVARAKDPLGPFEVLNKSNEWQPSQAAFPINAKNIIEPQVSICQDILQTGQCDPDRGIYGAGQPSVIFIKNQFLMLYSDDTRGCDQTNSPDCLVRRPYLASSTDGINFTKIGSIPLPESELTFDSSVLSFREEKQKTFLYLFTIEHPHTDKAQLLARQALVSNDTTISTTDLKWSDPVEIKIKNPVQWIHNIGVEREANGSLPARDFLISFGMPAHKKRYLGTGNGICFPANQNCFDGQAHEDIWGHWDIGAILVNQFASDSIREQKFFGLSGGIGAEAQIFKNPVSKIDEIYNHKRGLSSQQCSSDSQQSLFVSKSSAFDLQENGVAFEWCGLDPQYEYGSRTVFLGENGVDYVLYDQTQQQIYVVADSPIERAEFQWGERLPSQPVSSIHSFFTVDRNEDGLVDLGVSYFEDLPNCRALVSEIRLSFQNMSIQDVWCGAGPSSTLAFGDLDGDGKLDRVLFEGQNAQIFAFLGSGQDAQEMGLEWGESLPPGLKDKAIAPIEYSLFDSDSDGQSEIYVQLKTHNSIELYKRNSSTSWSAITSVPTNDPQDYFLRLGAFTRSNEVIAGLISNIFGSLSWN